MDLSHFQLRFEREAEGAWLRCDELESFDLNRIHSLALRADVRTAYTDDRVQHQFQILLRGIMLEPDRTGNKRLIAGLAGETKKAIFQHGFISFPDSISY